MNWLSWIAIYFVLWWLCLFMVLPFKVRNQVDVGEITPGTEPGAPVAVRMGPKLLITTGLAAVLQILLMWALSASWLKAYWS